MNITRTIIGVMISGALLSTAACGDLQGGQPSQAPERSEEGPSATTSVPSTTSSSSLEAQTTESSPPEAKTTGAETPKTAQAERTQEEVVVVKIRGLQYIRSPVTVAAGTTVRWVNEDVADHTVTSEDPGGPLRSEAFGQGGSFKHRFREVGEFAYYCEIHPSMKASVIVK
jgi:plastocyanin